MPLWVPSIDLAYSYEALSRFACAAEQSPELTHFCPKNYRFWL